MKDPIINLDGEETFFTDPEVFQKMVIESRRWGLELPPGAVMVGGRPYLTIQARLLMAERFEQEGDHQMAASIRQHCEERRQQAHEKLMARGLTGKSAGVIIPDELGAATPDPDRDPVPGLVRLGFLVAVMLAGVLVFGPSALREAIAFFSRF